MKQFWLVGATAATFLLLIVAFFIAVLIPPGDSLDHTPTSPPAGFTPHPLS